MTSSGNGCNIERASGSGPVPNHYGQEERRDRDSPLLVLQQGPERRPQADRGPDGLHLRRVRRGLQRHHRGRQPVREPRRPLVAALAARDQEVPRRVRHRPGAHQEEARRRRLQPLQAHRDPEAAAQPQRRRADQVEHPADRPDRHRQDAARADAGQAALGPVHDRRRHHAHRGRATSARTSRTSSSSCCRPPAATSRSASRASSTSTRSTRSAARTRTPRSPATCRARASSRRC